MVDKKKNPKNELSPLFKRLTRLFSGPIVNYDAQTPRKLKKRQLDKYANRFRSLAGLDFKRSAYNPFENLQSTVMNQHNRGERYGDFDQMEYYPILASAIDIYADEMTTHSIYAPILNVECPNEEISGILNTLFYNVLNIEHNLYGWCRSLCKYGDFFLYLDLNEDIGVKSVISLPTQEVERLEGEDKENPNYIQFQWNAGGLTFENWQLAHFRILGNDKYAPYGTSVLEPARRIWRQLTMMEDAMMSYRIIRSPERLIYKIDVGGIAPEDVPQFIEKVITSTRRHSVVDPDTGRVDLRYNPLSVEENIFLPVRGENSATEITALPGGQNTTQIDDIQYLKNNLFAAIKIPEAYLSMGKDAGNEDKTTLSQKDIRFSRTIQRLQRSVIAELEKIAIVHLFTLGYRGEDIMSFKLKLNNPSKLAQIQELEHWRTKFEVAGQATNSGFSRPWVSRNVFNLTDDEFVRNQYERFYDQKIDLQLEAMAQEPGFAAGGEGGAPGGGAPPMDLAAPEGEGALDADMGMEEPVAPSGPEEKTPLLAAPGEAPMGPPAGAPAKKDTQKGSAFKGPVPMFTQFSDGSYTTRSAKGKRYKPVATDKRRGMGPRRKNAAALTGKKQGSSHPGKRELDRIGLGLYESKEKIFEKLERDIHEYQKEVDEVLETVESDKDEI